MVTFGIYGLISYHQYSNEMKQYASVGKGGFKLWHLIFLIPPLTLALPFWMLARMLGFLRSIKELEARTGHMTKLSLGFLIMWSLGGMVLGGGSMLIFNLLPSFGSFESHQDHCASRSLHVDGLCHLEGGRRFAQHLLDTLFHTNLSLRQCVSSGVKISSFGRLA